MSQRSIIELNHDCSFAIADVAPEAFRLLLLHALAGGSNRDWEPLKRFGIRRIVQCHHSDDRKVVVGTGSNQREYPIG